MMEARRGEGISSYKVTGGEGGGEIRSGESEGQGGGAAGGGGGGGEPQGREIRADDRVKKRTIALDNVNLSGQVD
jgi:hypothetical protein